MLTSKCAVARLGRVSLCRAFAAPPNGWVGQAGQKQSGYPDILTESKGTSRSAVLRLHETREELMSRSQEHQEWRVHLRDPAELRRKVNTIRRDGVDDMMIMADFDQTLSMLYMPDGLVAERNERVSLLNGDTDVDENGQIKSHVQADPSMRVMFQCDRITQKQIEEQQALFRKYYPIEKDPSISIEEKHEHMRNWWIGNYEMYSSLMLTESDFHKMLSTSRMACRYGILDLFCRVKANDVPFVVVSGGVKDVIDTIFHDMLTSLESGGTFSQQKTYEELKQMYNLCVLSNTFKYENRYNKHTGKVERTAVDYDERLLHSMNKYEFVNHIQKEQVDPLMRKHVMVVGDLTQDIKMIEPTNFDEKLNVGFLNDMKNEHLLDLYLEAYDVVITRDGPLSAVNLLVDTIAGKDLHDKDMQQYREFPQLEELLDVMTTK